SLSVSLPETNLCKLSQQRSTMFGAAQGKSFVLRRLQRFSAIENSNIRLAICESGCRQSSTSSGSGRRVAPTRSQMALPVSSSAWYSYHDDHTSFSESLSRGARKEAL